MVSNWKPQFLLLYYLNLHLCAVYTELTISCLNFTLEPCAVSFFVNRGLPHLKKNSTATAPKPQGKNQNRRFLKYATTTVNLQSSLLIMQLPLESMQPTQ
jgi:hypothetical protein